jgi:signal transduction histidine kinase
MSVDIMPHLRVRAAGADLTATVDALLENVFSHTPGGTAVEVTLVASPEGGGRLVVADHGPGFAMPQQRGLSGAGSTGLGLDIARRTTESAGGGMVLAQTAGGGATAERYFPGA